MKNDNEEKEEEVKTPKQPQPTTQFSISSS